MEAVKICLLGQVTDVLFVGSIVYDRYNNYKLKDLKKVYQVSKKETTAKKLEELEAKWGAKYPVIIKS